MKIPDIFFAEGEEWREIKGYENLYWISNLGRVLSKRSRVFKIKKLQIHKTGYYHITLCKNYIKKDFLVHRLVVSHFIGDFYENNNSTNHKNCVRTDNRVENLEICSYAYNNKYAYKHGNKKPIYLIGKNNPVSIKVVRLDLEGKYIDEFVNLKTAANFICLTNLRLYTKGKKIVSNKGYIFMKKSEFDNDKNLDGNIDLPKFRKSINHNLKACIYTKELRKVVQLDKLGNLIEIFDSYKLAESKIGKRGVLDVCRNRIYNGKRYLTCGGYKWMYYEDYINKVQQ
jgi:hypothetical protein